VSTQEIRDPDDKLLGYIETLDDGRLQAADADYRLLGYFDPDQNETRDPDDRVLARGNILSALIYDQR
jgi:hypothetical protein